MLLLGAPVTMPGNGDEKRVVQEVWLPGDANGFHFFTGKEYRGGQHVTVESPLDEFPLFVRGGYPLPMQPYTERMCSTPLTELVVRCYPGDEGCDNSYVLYEDDGLTTGYQQGRSASTQMGYRREGGQVVVTVSPARGSYEGQPQKRAYRFELPGVPAGAKVRVNGKSAKAVYDEALGGIVVCVKPCGIRKPVELRVYEAVSLRGL